MTIEDLGIDSQPQNAPGKKQKTRRRRKKKHPQQENSENKKPATKNKQKRNRNEKRKKANAKKLTPSIDQDNSEVFHSDEIAANKEASALISELVNCYMNNSELPEEEFEMVHRVLHDKTVSAFSDALNKCVEKLFNKLMNTEYFKESLSKRVVKKDAHSQTDISYGNSSS